MVSKKSALGKGLGALIPDKIEEKAKGDIMEININEISPNEEQPRRSFDEDKLQSLAQSIKEHGIIQPVVVQKDGNFYKIIAGERRWRASRIAGLKKIPVIIKELSKRDTMEISLIENLQREDLNPIEEALAYKNLIEEFKLTQEEIANRIGKSRPAIANSLRLLNLDKRVMNYIIEGILTEGHGKIIAGLDSDEIQYEVSKKVIDDGLNVRQTEKLIKNIQDNKPKEEKPVKKEIFVRDIEDRLKSYLGTKVTINKGKKKSKIEIEYYTEEDLQRIIDLLEV